jgi:hypothetical protein
MEHSHEHEAWYLASFFSGRLSDILHRLAKTVVKGVSNARLTFHDGLTGR